MLRPAFACFLVCGLLASCGGESAPEAGDRVEIDAPSGWKSFDQGVVAGAVPKSWSVRVISGEEFKRLSAEAVSSQEIFNESVRESVENLDPEDLSARY